MSNSDLEEIYKSYRRACNKLFKDENELFLKIVKENQEVVSSIYKTSSFGFAINVISAALLNTISERYFELYKKLNDLLED
jgi:hypothetical protein